MSQQSPLVGDQCMRRLSCCHLRHRLFAAFRGSFFNAHEHTTLVLCSAVPQYHDVLLGDTLCKHYGVVRGRAREENVGDTSLTVSASQNKHARTPFGL